MERESKLRVGFTVGHDGCNIISRRTSLPIKRHHHAALAALDIHQRNNYVDSIPEFAMKGFFEGCQESHYFGEPYCEGCWSIWAASGILRAAEEGDIDE